MNPYLLEMVGDAPDWVGTGRPRTKPDPEAHMQAHAKCKQRIESENLATLSTYCQNPPINGLGFCETHRPKGRD